MHTHAHLRATPALRHGGPDGCRQRSLTWMGTQMELGWMSNVVSDEQQIAALQGEIREAGETVRDLRLILGWMVVTPLIAVPVAALCRVCQQRRLFGLVAALDEQM